MFVYHKVSSRCTKIVTQSYSSSFSRAILLFPKEIREAIYNIYGFVRFADEIVDTFHDYEKKKLLDKFVADYHEALREGISLNPILHAFAETVKKYSVDQELIDSFISSMYKDLGEINYKTKQEYDEYIYGSAEVVGLMCLKVFVEGNQEMYHKLEPYAKSLGAAFQKINFLRDMQADYYQLNRVYFPNVDFQSFTAQNKLEIEKDIAADFAKAKIGIKMLPVSSKFAVYMAYRYYINLFHKIKETKPEILMKKRIRVSNIRKAYLLLEMIVSKNLNLVK